MGPTLASRAGSSVACLSKKRRFHQVLGVIAILRQLRRGRWPNLGKFRECHADPRFQFLSLGIVCRSSDLPCNACLATLNLGCALQKVPHPYRRMAEKSAFSLSANPLEKRLEKCWIASERLSVHSG